MRRPSLFILLLAAVVVSGCVGTRHRAKIYKLKNHHIVMHTERGMWFEYTLNNSDIDVDVPISSTGKLMLPSGGEWRSVTIQEEEEIAGAIPQAVETTTVSEDDNGMPEGTGNSDSGDSDGDGGE